MKTCAFAISLTGSFLFLTSTLVAQKFDYRLLAASKTSTLEKDMNIAADAGFVFGGVTGGDSAIGGKEVLVVMMKNLEIPAANRKYSLLAASKTGTLSSKAAFSAGTIIMGRPGNSL